jgi:hypothetical protein
MHNKSALTLSILTISALGMFVVLRAYEIFILSPEDNSPAWISSILLLAFLGFWVFTLIFMLLSPTLTRTVARLSWGVVVLGGAVVVYIIGAFLMYD